MTVAKLPLAILSLISILAFAIACANTPPTATPDIPATVKAGVAATIAAIIAAIPTNTPVPTAKDTLRLTSTPAPLPTAISTPILMTDNLFDGWIYYGPDCPDAYSNCAPISTEMEFLALFSYSDNDMPIWDRANIRITCETGAFDTEGLIIGTNDSLVGIWIGESESQAKQYFTPYGVEPESVWFARSGYRDIISLIKLAETTNQTLTIGVTAGPGYDTVVRLFDVTGFTVNYNRLPC